MPDRNYISLALTLVAIIIVYVAAYLFRLDAVKYRYDTGDRVKITGTIDQNPRIFEGKQQIKLADLSIYLERFPEYAYGDRIEAKGEVAEGKFGYFLKDPKVAVVSSDSRERFRKRLLEIFGFSLPTPFSGLAEGIVLGTKNSLDPAFYEALKRTGTLHVVVASGTNINLLGAVLLYMLVPILGRRMAILSSLLFIWAYVALIGFDSPIVRAGIMGSLSYLTVVFGRKIYALGILGIVGAIMLLINPLWAFDLGFQLSFAATAGILLFTDKLAKLKPFKNLTGLGSILKESLVTTLAAQVFVDPILFFTFGQISWISPLVNMFVLWTVPFIMIGGMFAGILGVIYEPLGKVGLLLIYPLLWWFVKIVELFG